jgi:hypothetical protein
MGREMKVGELTLEEARKYLIRKGWEWNKDAPHAWQYVLPPCPGQYRIEDAVSLQQSMDRTRKKTQ